MKNTDIQTGAAYNLFPKPRRRRTGAFPKQVRASQMKQVELDIPSPAVIFLREAISQVGGNEVYFLARLRWDEDQTVATVTEVEVFSRGNSVSAPAIIAGAEDWDLAIHNHPGGDLQPSDADLAVAAELGNREVGFAIIDNEASRNYLVVKPFLRQEFQSVDVEEVRGIFAPGGLLSSHLDGFESREGQVEMAVEVARSLNENRVVVAEAGTGIGKSFAYLVPCILWAVKNRQRVIVSTGTINLQEQLVAKDLPFLAGILPLDFEFALIKGRHNYACKRRTLEAPEQFELVPEEAEDQEMLRDIIEWSRTTSDGSLADLAWKPPSRVWEKVRSETDKSLKVNCRFYRECFYYQAKRKATRSQLVVVNHHLFFADLAIRRQTGDYQFDLVLPGYSRAVFDEAHHLEDVASEHLGTSFSRTGIGQRLGRMRSKRKDRGILVLLARKLRQNSDPAAAETVENGYATQLRQIAESIDDQFGDLEEMLKTQWLSLAQGPGVDPAAGHCTLRYRVDPETWGLWNSIRDALIGIRGDLETVCRLNDRACETVENSAVHEDVKRSILLELGAFGNRMADYLGGFSRFNDFDDETQVRWLEYGAATGGKGGARLGFSVAPISVADDLRSALFEALETVVLTSATLSVAGKPDFLGERLGFLDLPPERFNFKRTESPFDFKRQTLMVVPTDLPAPDQPGYEERLPSVLLDLLKASGGKAFVLFTSHALLGRMHERLEKPLVEMGCNPLAQGQAQRSELLKRFSMSDSGVLFGTDSFWEGVDVRGSALEHVIITRLPFRVPTEPLQEARLEDLEARGINAFNHYTIPQAVLRFKQGFGRLVRSKTDRGVVSVLDQRILTRRYGKVFLETLPEVDCFASSSSAVVQRVEEFFMASGEAAAQ